jgi:hypothetical protein
MVGYDCAVSVLLVAAVQNSASGVQRVHYHSPGQKGVNNCHNIDTKLLRLPRQALCQKFFSEFFSGCCYALRRQSVELVRAWKQYDVCA